MARQMFGFFLYLYISITIVNTEADKDCFYKAAVYEHFSVPALHLHVTRSEALKVININLDKYEEQVKEASSKGSQIIVFPEDGITGLFLGHTRKSILSFLEIVPNKTQPVVNPCMQDEHLDRPIQRRLSCLAKQYSIIIVADLASMQLCDEKDPHCPIDGHYQFNTALAFDSDGSLLAIYHKSNLYTDESNIFDSGSRSSIATGVFSTKFGTFALFICFDILFDYPSLYFDKFKVDSVAFPTGWMNELPLLSAIEYQQAWALGMNMNLLASNQHLPINEMTGSGLYSATEGAVAYHYDMQNYTGKLVIADLPCYPSKISKHGDNEHMSGKDVTKVPYEIACCYSNLTNLELNAIAGKKAHIKSKMNQKADFVKTDDTFTSLVNDDPYILKLLTKTQGFISITDHDLNCTLNYTLKDTWQAGDWYAFGAFSGLHTKNGQYFVQACVLLRCAKEQKSLCGAQTSLAHTQFKDVSLGMSGYSSKTFLTPEILTDGVALPKRRLAWDTNKKFDLLWSHQDRLKEPLLMAGIYGRRYECDGD